MKIKIFLNTLIIAVLGTCCFYYLEETIGITLFYATLTIIVFVAGLWSLYRTMFKS